MNVNSITSQLSLYGLGDDFTQKLAQDAVHFFSRKFLGIQPLRIKHDLAKGINAALPCTVVRTHEHSVYILQTKGGIQLLGKGATSKVSLALRVNQEGLVEMVKAKIVHHEIALVKKCCETAQQITSRYVESPALLTYEYTSEKKQMPRLLFIGECLAFDASSPEMRALPALQQFSILADVAEALFVIHNMGLVHNDIKPENILVRHNPHAKGLKQYEGVLSDLGFLRENYSSGLVGSPLWIAPESIRQNSSYKEKDLWAFGILCYQVFKTKVNDRDDGFPPFIIERKKNTHSVHAFYIKMLKLGDHELTPDSLFPKKWSIMSCDVLERIILNCLSLDLAGRMSAKWLSKFMREHANEMQANAEQSLQDSAEMLLSASKR